MFFFWLFWFHQDNQRKKNCRHMPGFISVFLLLLLLLLSLTIYFTPSFFYQCIQNSNFIQEFRTEKILLIRFGFIIVTINHSIVFVGLSTLTVLLLFSFCSQEFKRKSSDDDENLPYRKRLKT